MRARAPARLGTALSSVWTPALLVSLPQLEQNESRMRELLHGTGVALRPHAKAHKSGSFAAWHEERARAAGAPLAGFCAQSTPPPHLSPSSSSQPCFHSAHTVQHTSLCHAALSEVEALLRSGCTDVLLTNELPPMATLRLAECAAAHPEATVSLLVDCPEHVEALDSAAAVTGATNLGALVEIECGQQRCGCPPASDMAVALAKQLVASERLRWGGLHVYHGGIQHVRAAAERMAAVNAGPASAAERTVARLAQEGISDVPLVTGGGTGTFLQDVAAGTHDEIQPGSYLLMDGDYGDNTDAAHKGFAQSLYIHTTVVSSDGATGRRVVDAGSKAVDLVSGPPKATSVECADLASALGGVTYTSGGDEHGVLHGVPDGVLPVGATLQLVPSHCDPTCNLHDWLVGVRDGTVEELFEIDARGYKF